MLIKILLLPLVLSAPAVLAEPQRESQTFCVEFRWQRAYVRTDGEDTPEKVLGNREEIASLGYDVSINGLAPARFVVRMSTKRTPGLDIGIYGTPRPSLRGATVTVLDTYLPNSSKVLEVRRFMRGSKRLYTSRVVNRKSCDKVVGAFDNPYRYEIIDFPVEETKFDGDGAQAVAERTFRISFEAPVEGDEAILSLSREYRVIPQGPIRYAR